MPVLNCRYKRRCRHANTNICNTCENNESLDDYYVPRKWYPKPIPYKPWDKWDIICYI